MKGEMAALGISAGPVADVNYRIPALKKRIAACFAADVTVYFRLALQDT